MILLSLLLCAGGTALWIDAGANAKWERMRARVAELRKQVDDRVRNRPSLADDPIPGNAWEDYERADEEFLVAYAAWSGPGDFRERLGLLSQPADPAVLQGIIDRYPEILNRLKQGVRRSSLHPTGAERSHRDLWDLVRLAMSRGESLISRGRTPEGMGWMLVALAAARDLTLMNHRADLLEPLRFIAFDPEWTPVHSFPNRLSIESMAKLAGALQATLPHAELAAIDRRLRRLERLCFPAYGPSLEQSMIRVGEDYLNWRFTVMFDPLRQRKSLWNARIAVSSVFEQLEAWVSRMTAIDALPWAEARPTLERLEREMRDAPVWSHTFRTDTGDRIVVSHLRLLRTAVGYRLTGELHLLPDPYGDTLRSRMLGDRVRIWSVGPNGIDDGGAGDDLVLELSR